MKLIDCVIILELKVKESGNELKIESRIGGIFFSENNCVVLKSIDKLIMTSYWRVHKNGYVILFRINSTVPFYRNWKPFS